jgi:dihydroorotate dehydrogenase
VVAERDAGAEHFGRRPVLLKIAPDLGLNDLDHLVQIVRKHRIDGMIVTNTTLSRPASLQDKALMGEAGGLSGKPLFALSTRILAETFQRVEGQFPLIGVGGIDSAEAAIAKIEAGASLIQLYSALVYHGPALIGAIKQGLERHLAAQGLSHVGQMVGRRSAGWAAQAFPLS